MSHGDRNHGPLPTPRLNLKAHVALLQRRFSCFLEGKEIQHIFKDHYSVLILPATF